MHSLRMDRAMETRHLAVADRNIAEGEARVTRQVALIERLEMRGADTGTAEAFLDLLRQTLAGWNRQRDLVVAALKESSPDVMAIAEHRSRQFTVT